MTSFISLSCSTLGRLRSNKTRSYFFSLRQALSELVQAGLLDVEELPSSSRYEITADGEQTLEFFGKQLSPEIIADIDEFLRDNHLRIREEVGIISDYLRTDGSEDYNVHCEVREGKARMFGLDITVPDEGQASLMSRRFKERNQEIYSFIIRTLLSED